MNGWMFYVNICTIACLIVVFMLGKLRLLSLVWLYYLQKKHEPATGVSVVICTRNDLKNLQQNLPFILAQKYSTYEVVVVDDASEDETWPYLQGLAATHPHLKPVHVSQKTQAGKKWALQKGIEQATYPFILVTDADCKPVSGEWIHSHAGFIQEQPMVVLGYGAYKKEKGWLNLLIRFDTAYIASQYMSKALWKYPYMGVGRNMGYAKTLADNLVDIDTRIASGDDDLFVQAITRKAHFMVNIEKQSFTESPAKKTWKLWLAQKGRHTTTAPQYGFLTQAGIMIQWLASTGVYMGCLLMLIAGEAYTALTLLMLNALSIILFNGLWFSKLGEKDIILLAPLLDFIYTFVQPIFVVKSWGRKKEEWN